MKRAMKDLPGGVGYGAIVLTMEALRCEVDFKFPVKDLDLLALEFDISLPILQTVISKYGFFETIHDEIGEVFFSPILSDLMIPYIEKQKQNQIAGKISAQKRKLKQKQQLEILSQLDSSKHVLDKCATGVKQNRVENKREEEKISLFTDFKVFKKHVLSSYKGKVVCFGPTGFLDTTAIEVTSQFYLKNKFTKKDLSKEDAIKVWKWMFENQDKLCNIELEGE